MRAQGLIATGALIALVVAACGSGNVTARSTDVTMRSHNASESNSCPNGIVLAHSAREYRACQATLRAEETKLRADETPAAKKIAAHERTEQAAKQAALELKTRSVEEAVNRAPAELRQTEQETGENFQRESEEHEEKKGREEELRGAQEYSEAQRR